MGILRLLALLYFYRIKLVFFYDQEINFSFIDIAIIIQIRGLTGILTLPIAKARGFLLPKAESVSSTADVQDEAVSSALVDQDI